MDVSNILLTPQKKLKHVIQMAFPPPHNIEQSWYGTTTTTTTNPKSPSNINDIALVQVNLNNRLNHLEQSMLTQNDFTAPSKHYHLDSRQYCWGSK